MKINEWKKAAILISLKMICSTYNIDLNGQCSFQFISNDTLYQDYIDYIYSRHDEDEIITIGSQISRGATNNNIYNAPVFKSFDYCGRILTKVVYRNIDNYILKHSALPNHIVYTDEPIGNKEINITDNEYLIIDKAIDTIIKKAVLILFNINSKGQVLSYKTIDLNAHEANQTTIKNVLLLENGNILVILWNYLFEYVFLYFNEKKDLILKKTIGLGREMQTIKEIPGGDYICTSLTSDTSSFQFYRLDTAGQTKWIVSPYKGFGTARNVFIKENKIYVLGTINGSGVLLICDFNGNTLKDYKFDSYYCNQNYCNALLESDDIILISGYIDYCDINDHLSSDIVLIRINSSGKIIWNNSYNFINSLGTTGPNGYYPDFGGFLIAKGNDESIITNGYSRYNRLVPGGQLYEDETLIKTESNLINKIKNLNSNIKEHKFKFHSNPISESLILDGPVELIENWIICSVDGEILIKGNKWQGKIEIKSIEAGIYFLKIFGKEINNQYIKFIKN